MDEQLLDDVAKALKVTLEAIKNFNDESVINYVQNNYDHAIGVNYNFNPIDKWIEALEENKELYERLPQAEKEKVALLEKLMKQKR
ncbi:hypothetical protein [Flavisolibacter nicotianae]|uniref:hypothetical protein n=1 Tax=Flavisolibacter nicotianae TaxID=2364882 RepID=UPI001F08CA16|nr:hypothetical protein [Flavisolibacter nicotianae]